MRCHQESLKGFGAFPSAQVLHPYSSQILHSPSYRVLHFSHSQVFHPSCSLVFLLSDPPPFLLSSPASLMAHLSRWQPLERAFWVVGMVLGEFTSLAPAQPRKTRSRRRNGEDIALPLPGACA